MSDLPLLPTTVIGSHAKPGWWHACKELFEFGEWGEADLEELLDDAVDVAILDQQRAGCRHHQRRRIAPPRRVRRRLLRDHRGHRVDGAGAAGRPLGLRPADPLPGHGANRGAVRAGHRLRVRVPARAHRPADQGDLRRAAHLRVAHPAGGCLREHGRDRGRVRQRHQRGAEGARRRRGGLHPDRRAGEGHRHRPGDGAAVQHGDRGRRREARLPHLLRQPVRTGAVQARLRRLLPRRDGGQRATSSCWSSRAGRWPRSRCGRAGTTAASSAPGSSTSSRSTRRPRTTSPSDYERCWKTPTPTRCTSTPTAASDGRRATSPSKSSTRWSPAHAHRPRGAGRVSGHPVSAATPTRHQQGRIDT